MRNRYDVGGKLVRVLRGVLHDVSEVVLIDNHVEYREGVSRAYYNHHLSRCQQQLEINGYVIQSQISIVV